MDDRSLSCNGTAVRVWEQGDGETVVFLAGFGGLPKWIPFLDRLAESRRVIVPSLPGFPGAEGHGRLDDLSDWTAATLEILEGATDGPFGLIASSVSAPLALEAAAMQRQRINRLVLVGPFGIHDERPDAIDLWAQRPGPKSYPPLLCANPERYAALWQKPDDVDEIEWQVTEIRAREAAARYLWPLNDTGILKRAYRLTQPMLLIRGSADRLVPRASLEKLKSAVTGEAVVHEVANAGHLVELDQPEALAGLINQFL